MKPRLLTIGVIVLLLLLFSGISLASAANGYSLDWWTIDGGGGTSSGGSYSLSGTIGQPDAITPLSGGSYGLIGGFWGGASVPYNVNVYVPLVKR